ncbi:VENN motif pre-toxin domain-containing protein, partial [Achromobacter xylosoxidans]
AHAVLGAVTAQLNGQSPLAGGLGAGGGELAARVIARQLFPGKDPDALSETEKQQVSALSQLAAGIAGGLATGDAAGGVTGAQAGRNAVENNFLDVVQLEDFAHRAKVGTGEERQKVIRDMVDTNVRQQDEIKEVCAKSPQQCQQRYGYLLDEWELFDDTIKRLAKDKSLPDDFRDYMPAVYMSDVDAGGIVAEHGWTKRFEAMGFDADTARVMAATLPAVVSSVGGGKVGKGAGGGPAQKSAVTPKSQVGRVSKGNKNEITSVETGVRSDYQELIKNAERISTAKPGKQFTAPRDLNEQILWNKVKGAPAYGQALVDMNNDKNFPKEAGFQKMQMTHELPDGSNITIHYQYNSISGRAYDIKITTPKRSELQPGVSIRDRRK